MQLTRAEKRTLEIPTLSDAQLLAELAPPAMERIEFSVDWSDNEPTREIPGLARKSARCFCVLCKGAPL